MGKERGRGIKRVYVHPFVLPVDSSNFGVKRTQLYAYFERECTRTIGRGDEDQNFTTKIFVVLPPWKNKTETLYCDGFAHKKNQQKKYRNHYPSESSTLTMLQTIITSILWGIFQLIPLPHSLIHKPYHVRKRRCHTHIWTAGRSSLSIAINIMVPSVHSDVWGTTSHGISMLVVQGQVLPPDRGKLRLWRGRSGYWLYWVLVRKGCRLPKGGGEKWFDNSL